jgi:hypothetical protein
MELGLLTSVYTKTKVPWQPLDALGFYFYIISNLICILKVADIEFIIYTICSVGVLPAIVSRISHAGFVIVLVTLEIYQSLFRTF